MKLKYLGISIGLGDGNVGNRGLVYIIYLIRHKTYKFSPDPLVFLYREKVSIS